MTHDIEIINPKDYPFFQLFESVMRIPQDVLNDGEKALLLRLYLYANRKSGKAWPNRAQVAAALGGLSVSQVDRRMITLKEKGFIRVSRGQRVSSSYEFLATDFLPSLHAHDYTPAPADLPEDGEPTDMATTPALESADLQSQESAYTRTLESADTRTPTIKDPHIEKSQGKKAEEPPQGETVEKYLPPQLASPGTQYPRLAQWCRHIADAFKVNTYPLSYDTGRFQQSEKVLTAALEQAMALGENWENWLARHTVNEFFAGAFIQHRECHTYAYTLISRLITDFSEAMHRRYEAMQRAEKEKGKKVAAGAPERGAEVAPGIFSSGMDPKQAAWIRRQREAEKSCRAESPAGAEKAVSHVG